MILLQSTTQKDESQGRNVTKRRFYFFFPVFFSSCSRITTGDQGRIDAVHGVLDLCCCYRDFFTSFAA
jgi:hypothetical protein